MKCSLSTARHLQTAWILIGYEGKTLTLKSKGTGGRKECLDAIVDDSAVLFGACETSPFRSILSI